MKLREKINYGLTVALVLLAILLIISSVLLWLVFPRGFFPDRVLWLEIHKWGGLTLLAAVLFHIILHWKWLVHMTRRYIRR